jgi:hypothetical protein
MNGVAVEEEFLRQRGLARIGMRDDREGATTGDFLGWRHEKEPEGRGNDEVREERS